MIDLSSRSGLWAPGRRHWLRALHTLRHLQHAAAAAHLGHPGWPGHVVTAGGPPRGHPQAGGHFHQPGNSRLPCSSPDSPGFFRNRFSKRQVCLSPFESPPPARHSALHLGGPGCSWDAIALEELKLNDRSHWLRRICGWDHQEGFARMGSMVHCDYSPGHMIITHSQGGVRSK